MKRTITLLAVALSTVAPTAAFADGTDGATERQSGDDWTYTFPDANLLADGLGPTGATIVIRPKAAHATLIRPRTQFVQEMLKSVEGL